MVTESILELGLFQMCNLSNSSGNVLDLIYTNSPELLISELAIRRLIPPELSDKAHNPISLSLECEPNTFNTNNDPELHYCFKKANYQVISEHLDSIDWSTVLSSDTVDEMMECFYKVIQDIFNEFVPKAIIRSSKNPVWFTKKLCNMKNIRNREYKKYCEAKKQNDTALDISNFQNAERLLTTESKSSYDNHIREVATNAKSNPKKFWNFINDIRSSNSLPCKMVLDDKTVVTNAEKAELFAEFFSSVFIDRPADNQITQVLESRDYHFVMIETVSM